MFSAHNRDAHVRQRPWQLTNWRRPRSIAGDVVRFPASMRNYRRLRPLERDTGEYALRNDQAHGFTMVLYSIGAPAQERQLAEAGFALELCLTDDGDAVQVGSQTSAAPYLHYAARSSTPA